jgi:chaperonin GroEL
MVASDTAIFVTNFKLDNPYQVVALLNTVKAPKIALFSPEFSPMVIKSLIETTKNGLFCYPVKCPSLRTEQLEDLAVYTGATLIDKDTGKKLENVTKEDLGFAEKIIVKDTENKEDAILLGGKGDKVKRGTGTMVTERCNILKAQIKEARNELTKMSLNRRIANLSSAVGIIRVGATTNNESLFLKLKIEDGVFACKAALEEGFVRGGGLCLKKIADKMGDNILSDSLRAPYEQIQRNAGGFYEIAEDIIDPAKVVRLEVEHGISVASMLITADISIPEIPETSPGAGYEAIAKAINTFAYYDAKHKGLIKESEMDADRDAKQRFDEVMFNDHD